MKLHRLVGYIQNIFLAEYEHGCLLLDGCCKADFDLIVKYFKNKLKRPLSDLKFIVVTHMHPDHAGCAEKLKKASGAKIGMGQFDSHWYGGVYGRISHIADIYLAQWVAGRMGKEKKSLWYRPNLVPDMWLVNGARIPEFEDWEVIYTPGHTSIDITLVNTKANRIYVADLIVSVKNSLSPPYPVHFPCEYTESIKTLKPYIGFKMSMAHVEDTILTVQIIDSILLKVPTEPQSPLGAIKERVLKINRNQTQSKD